MRFLGYILCGAIGGAAAVTVLNVFPVPAHWSGTQVGFVMGWIFGTGVTIGLVAAHVLFKTSTHSSWED